MHIHAIQSTASGDNDSITAWTCSGATSPTTSTEHEAAKTVCTMHNGYCTFTFAESLVSRIACSHFLSCSWLMPNWLFNMANGGYDKCLIRVLFFLLSLKRRVVSSLLELTVSHITYITMSPNPPPPPLPSPTACCSLIFVCVSHIERHAIVGLIIIIIICMRNMMLSTCAYIHEYFSTIIYSPVCVCLSLVLFRMKIVSFHCSSQMDMYLRIQRSMPWDQHSSRIQSYVLEIQAVRLDVFSQQILQTNDKTTTIYMRIRAW